MIKLSKADQRVRDNSKLLALLGAMVSEYPQLRVCQIISNAIGDAPLHYIESDYVINMIIKNIYKIEDTEKKNRLLFLVSKL